jgi:hypothetical protein
MDMLNEFEEIGKIAAASAKRKGTKLVICEGYLGGSDVAICSR